MGQLTVVTGREEQIEKLTEIYKETWQSEDSFIRERILRHSNYEGYKGFILSEGEEPVGFAYGYTSQKGQYYNELLREALAESEQQNWLDDCFEVVELAVRPSQRNRGYGRQIMMELLKESNHKTAILTTQVDNLTARRLYEKMDWQVVKEPFYPSDTENSYVILGKKLN
ncbi:GNAT family N-acetyltransferase [Radiobacillus kanasensis]|uniref:GNAT family N-acetyltransferase n=1 Tax=Radiobacillus kanasensis TaxID=2844358 RepID=UPI001E54D8B3|nr:GNAT family N-acetyltransferase [Radiobacillus kanasensis]UFU00303.1 GNAT family N-acetyltransferase [Radiobacillus kanasensis]